LINNARHHHLLLQVREHLCNAHHTLSSGFPIDLLSIDLETALVLLGEISGKTAQEELLNTIFSQFCLGK